MSRHAKAISMTQLTQGVQVEKQWKTILQRQGHIVTKAPSSGRGTGSFYDLHSTDRSGRPYLWEIKSVSAWTKYFDQDELFRISKLAATYQTHHIFPYVVVLFKAAGRFKVYKPSTALKHKKLSFQDRGETWFMPIPTYRKSTNSSPVSNVKEVEAPASKANSS